MAAIEAEASAVIARDGESWGVVGGLALRPREWLSELPAGSWLVDAVVHQEQAVIVEDTDIARQQLMGVPLARFRQLLIVPVPAIRGAILVGRTDEPFTEEDLRTIIEIAGEATAELREALLLRDVADALHRFAERRNR